MAMLLNAVSTIAGLVAFVCFIMVVVKMFQNNQTGLGIASILTLCLCGIGHIIALIVGWQNADSWGIRQLVLVYTVCLVTALVLGGAAGAMGGFNFKMPQ